MSRLSQRVLLFSLGAGACGLAPRASAQLELPRFPGERYEIGARPSSIAAVDLDADGRLDVIVGHEFPASVQVFKGDGFGGLSSIDLNVADQFAIDIETADLDQDGFLDAVVACAGPSSIRIYRGDGTGNLTFKSTINFGGTMSSVELTDLDANGFPDLVATSSLTAIRVYRANATGSAFLPPTLLPVPGGQTDLVFADMTGDGDLDIVATVNSPVGATGVYLLPGLAGPAFAPASMIGPGTASFGLTRLAVADLNADAILDVAYAGTGGVPLRILIGTGGGSFLPPAQTGFPQSVDRLALTDFDGDSLVDLVTCAQLSTSFNVAHGNGNGTFSMPVARVISGGSMDFAIADMNGDMIADVAVADYDSRAIGIALGAGGGEFQHAASTPVSLGVGTTGVFFDIAGTCDANGDGDLDYVTTGFGTNLHVLPGNGRSQFGPTITSPTALEGILLRVGDVNGDGVVDVVTAAKQNSAGPFEVLLGLGNGSFVSAGPSPVTGIPVFRDLELADADHDGDLDLYGCVPATKLIRLLTNDGSGAFAATGSVPFPVNPVSVQPELVVFDADGDLDEDVFTLNNDANSYSVLLSNGAGSIALSQTIATGVKMQSGFPTHVDADGILDLVVTNNFQQLAFFKGTGSAVFAPPVMTPLQGQTKVVPIATDMDTDGTNDLVGIRTGLKISHVVVLKGDGQGHFPAHRMFSIHGSTAFGTAADFDHDGIAEVVTLGQEPTMVFPNATPAISVFDTTCLGAVGTHGYGCSNGVDATPRLALEGCPRIKSGVTLRIEASPAATVALLLFGQQPANLAIPGSGCSLLVTPLLPISVPIALASGSVSLPFHVPASAASTSIEIQAFVPDVVAPAGFVATNGITVIFE